MKLPPGIKRDRWVDETVGSPIDAELAFHVEARIEELVAAGVSPAAAREQALREFGPIAPIAAHCRNEQHTRKVRMSRLGQLRGFLLELKSTVRGLVRSPGYALVAIATLALGIGATTAVFSVFDGVLLKKLPYRHLDRLVRVWERSAREGRPGQLAIGDFRDYVAESKALDGLAAFRWQAAALAGADGGVTQLEGAAVTDRFFELLGVTPALGRLFSRGDDDTGSPFIVVLSYRAWRDRFGADPAILTRTVRVNDVGASVVGVLPAEFVNPMGDEVDVWYPSAFNAIASDPSRAHRMHFLSGIGRLASTTTIEAAQSEMDAIGAGIVSRATGIDETHTPWLVPLQQAGVRDVRSLLVLVLAAVGCLLLITCANLANLVFARSLARAREFAVRSALGAGRARIVRQVLVEQLLLTGIGAVVGFVIAGFAVKVGIQGLGQMIPRLGRVTVDERAFLVAAGLALFAALASGLVPALIAVNRDGVTGRPGLTRGAARGRDLLVAVQTGLAALLLVSAGLAARSIARLLDEDLGFRTERIWTFQTSLSPNRYRDQASGSRFRTTLLERLRTIPGITSAAVTYAPPMRNTSTTSVVVEGEPVPSGSPPEVGYNAAEGQYFATLGIPLLEGRTFDDRDRPGSTPVLVINKALADHFFPGRSPIGLRVKSGPDPNEPTLEIVGVVGNIRRQSQSMAPTPELYYALSQDGTSLPTFVIKIEGDPVGVLAAVRSAVREIDAQVPVATPTPLEEVVGRTTRNSRAVAALLVAFSLLALLVAAVGIYGVISFLVAERQREIAIRLAIGASRRRVLTETTIRGITPTLWGLGGGIALALVSGSIISKLLYRTAPTDPVTYLVVTFVVLATALVGALIPGIRASRVAPARVLRD